MIGLCPTPTKFYRNALYNLLRAPACLTHTRSRMVSLGTVNIKRITVPSADFSFSLARSRLQRHPGGELRKLKFTILGAVHSFLTNIRSDIEFPCFVEIFTRVPTRSDCSTIHSESTQCHADQTAEFAGSKIFFNPFLSFS